MQTILGGGGAIGNALAKALFEYTNQVRIVSRTPKAVTGKEMLFSADLRDAAATERAVAGSEIVYLTAGLPYNTKTWQRDWPLIMQNVISACKKHGAKLVFFDNVYMYAPEALADMREDARVAPISGKGKVRAQLVEMLWQAQADGLPVLIARSADFYGPGAEKVSLLSIGVLENFRKKRKAMWLADDTKIHSFTFTEDAARATALLGNTPDAYGETWHLPTSEERFSGKDWVALAASVMKVPARHWVLRKRLLGFMGLFSLMMRELREMQYQNDRDYFFNSEKFRQRFPEFSITDYELGLRQTVETYKVLETWTMLLSPPPLAGQKWSIYRFRLPLSLPNHLYYETLRPPHFR